MKEVTGNLWTYPADVRVITTNGTVKKNGECVMGRGCAAEAKKHIPRIAEILGSYIHRNGNLPHYLATYMGAEVYSFPVKHNWFEKADIELIRESAQLLSEYPSMVDRRIVIPRPGCGNGGLRWCWCDEPNDDLGEHCLGVKHILEPILDDRFHVITFK